MRGRRVPFAICMVFAVLGLVLVVGGDPGARAAGAASLLLFGLGGLALAAPLLTRRGPGTTRIVELGVERGFAFPLGRAKQLIALLAAAGMASGSALLWLLGDRFAGLLGTVVFGIFTLIAAFGLTRERGLTLTPTRVIVTGLRRRELAWEEIDGVGFSDQGPSRFLRIDPVDGRTVLVPADQLAGPPERAAGALIAYLEDPARRSAIGTETELEVVEHLR